MKPTLGSNYIPHHPTGYYYNNVPSYPTFSGYHYSYANQLGQIPGQSHIEYYPYERKVIQYEDVEEITYEPYERKVIQYEERRRIEKVPVQKTYTDYYTVQHITQYIPEVIPQTHIEYIPVQKTQHRLEYYPVERQYLVDPHSIGQHSSSYHQAHSNTYGTATFTPTTIDHRPIYTKNNPSTLPSFNQSTSSKLHSNYVPNSDFRRVISGVAQSQYIESHKHNPSNELKKNETNK